MASWNGLTYSFPTLDPPLAGVSGFCNIIIIHRKIILDKQMNTIKTIG
jgi:hypothetical protein